MAIEAWAHPHPAGDPATGTGGAFLAAPSLAASTATPSRPAVGPGAVRQPGVQGTLPGSHWLPLQASIAFAYICISYASRTLLFNIAT